MNNLYDNHLTCYRYFCIYLLRIKIFLVSEIVFIFENVAGVIYMLRTVKVTVKVSHSSLEDQRALLQLDWPKFNGELTRIRLIPK